MYPVDQADVLLGAAEVPGDVRDAERLLLAAADPRLVFPCPGNSVQEDPESFPHGLLTN